MVKYIIIKSIDKFSLQRDLSDTEVLFSLIKSIGFEDSLNEIFGAFAICYVDLTNDSVILERCLGSKTIIL